MKKIILDCLGADKGQEEIAKGIIPCFDQDEYDFILLGEKEKLLPVLEEKGVPLSRVEIIDCSTTITNNENPTSLIKEREETSIVKGLLRAREEDVVAFVSAGSTGAILLGSIFRLGLLPGVKFPALGCTLVNIHRGPVCLVDCGANIDVNAPLLLKFAKMGNAFAKAYYKKESPRIGLLNVGKEERKGNKLSQEAHLLLKDSSLNFVGNMEGSDILLDKCDVIVSDGFAGNIVLKAIEATAMICKKLVTSIAPEDPNIQKASKDIYTMFGYTDLGASFILGSQKIVLKPHGSASEDAIGNILHIAMDMDRSELTKHLKESLDD